MSPWSEAIGNNYPVIFLHTVLHCHLPCLIGWLCGTDPISSVVMLVSKYGGGISWEYACAWQQLRTLHKHLDRQGSGDYWCVLTSPSCCSYWPTVLLWTCHKAAWLSGLKYLSTCWLALIGWPLRLSASES